MKIIHKSSFNRYLQIIIIGIMSSSMSMMGLFIPRSSLSFSMSMFWITFFVSATIAIALYTALSWATWYSGSNWKEKTMLLP